MAKSSPPADVTRFERQGDARADSALQPFSASPLERYAIEAELGRGGMAVVYRARDLVSGQVVALKQLLIQPDAARSRELLALFEREFHVLAQLSHPRVIKVYDYGLSDQGSYYTMELLDGGDLRELSPLPWARACKIAYDVCSSLALLHSRRFVHRDVSPRNVRCTREGAAKLIDFGAVIPMGIAAQIVGTPAFAAPEVVNRSSLDARTDLFSFGATLYFALTGQLAYPARSFAQLNEVWAQRLAPPSQFVPEIPAALDALVMDLLNVDAAVRPRSAFEVMQRLSAIASIEQSESIDVSRAYLATPVLAGREPIVGELAAGLKRAARRRGAAMLIEAESGAGRTRTLDSCALQAKLLGFGVLRVGAEPEVRTFSAAQRLIEQLQELAPDTLEAVRRSEPLTAALFVQSVEAGALPTLQDLKAPGVDRPNVQEALLRCFVRASEHVPLLITVDDVHEIDDASVALLAALARAATRRRLSLVFTRETAAPARAAQALAVLTGYCVRLELPPLAAHDTLSLLGSVFGDVPNLALLSDCVHQVAAGSPGVSMAIAEWLVQHGLIRYEGGSWSLPQQLTAADLPAREAAWLDRLSELSPLSLSLARSQALAVREALAREDYGLLANDVAAGAVDAALTELIARRVLVSDGRLYRFAQRGLRSALRAQLDQRDLSELHRALARMYAAADKADLIVLYHLLQGGLEDEALERLERHLANDAGGVSDLRYINNPQLPFKIVAEIYIGCLDIAERRKLSPLALGGLRRAIVGLAVVTDDATYWRAAPAFLEQITHDSGLLDWRTLGTLEPGPRLSQAFSQAMERYTQTPPQERGFRPDEAIKWLATYVALSLAIVGRSLDDKLLASLPPLLEPFAALSPVVKAIWHCALGTCDSRGNRVLSARARFESGYQAMGEMTEGDLRNVAMIRSACAFGIGTVEASLGIASAERWAGMLDSAPMLRVNAMYLRKVLALQRGDWDAAERFRKHAEILAVQAGAPQMFTAMLPAELQAHVLAGDLRGVRQIAERMAGLAESSPGWLPFRQLAHGNFLRACGHLEEARLEFERYLEHSDPRSLEQAGGPLAWSAFASAYVDVLLELGDAARARHWGQNALATLYELGVENPWPLEREVALAEAKTDDYAAAVIRLNRVIDAQRALGVGGVQLGASYEARLRVAIWSKDRPALDEYAELVAREYRHGLGSVLGARYERLVEEVERGGLSSIVHFSQLERSPLAATSSFEFVEQQLRTASDQDRGSRALGLVCEAFGSEAGLLYLRRGASLQLSAAVGALASAELQREAQACLERHLVVDDADTTLVDAPSASDEPEAKLLETAADYRFRALLTQDAVCVGVIALKDNPRHPKQVAPRAFLEAVASYVLHTEARET